MDAIGFFWPVYYAYWITGTIVSVLRIVPDLRARGFRKRSILALMIVWCYYLLILSCTLSTWVAKTVFQRLEAKYRKAP